MASRRSVERRWSWLASEQGCSSLGGRGKTGIVRDMRMPGASCVTRGPGGSEVI